MTFLSSEEMVVSFTAGKRPATQCFYIEDAMADDTAHKGCAA